MGLLRNFAHTLFSIALLAALWVTALSFLSMRGPSTAIITDLGVDALNPWLVSKGIGLDTAAYAKLQSAASANPGKPLPLTFIKPQVMGNEIKGVAYADGVRVIYTHVADAYYDGGPSATFNLPAPVAAVVQTFALFPARYDTAVKSTPLPSFIQPFLVYTGLTPDTFTATGHDRISGLVPKLWTPTLLLAAIIVALNFLSRKPPVTSLALAVWNGSWPTLAGFGIFWLIGRLYPADVHAVAAAFGVVAGQFVPVYGVAAAVGIGGYFLSKFLASTLKSVATSVASAPKAAASTSRAERAYADSAGRPAEAPAYAPRASSMYQPGGQQSSGAGYGSQQFGGASYGSPGYGGEQFGGRPAGSQPYGQTPAAQQPGWDAPAQQSWEQPGWDTPTQQQWGGSQRPSSGSGQPAWNQPRPWDAPDPNAQPQSGRAPQWGEYPPEPPQDPNAPRW